MNFYICKNAKIKFTCILFLVSAVTNISDEDNTIIMIFFICCLLLRQSGYIASVDIEFTMQSRLDLNS